MILKIISTQISWKKFFLEKNIFQGLGAFFVTAKPLFGADFFHIEFILYFFSIVIIWFQYSIKKML